MQTETDRTRPAEPTQHELGVGGWTLNNFIERDQNREYFQSTRACLGGNDIEGGRARHFMCRATGAKRPATQLSTQNLLNPSDFEPIPREDLP